jgi:fructose-1,6-bisphosphatase/inositol monophosphatase family enzyme
MPRRLSDSDAIAMAVYAPFGLAIKGGSGDNTAMIPHDIHTRMAGILCDVAERHILPHFGTLSAGEIECKDNNPKDRVTIADKAAEAALTRILLDMLPGSAVLGEEAVAKDKASLAAFCAAPPEFLWVVDPIDGTNAFIEGKTDSGTLITLCRHGEAIMSWQYQFHAQRNFVSEVGAGVMMQTITDGKIVEPPCHLAPWQDDYYILLSRRLPELGECKIPDTQHDCGRASVIDYPALLSGVADRPVHAIAYHDTRPWDHLASCLMANLLGLKVARWDGRPYTLANSADKGLLIAPDEHWDAIKAAIYPNGAPTFPSTKG